jgi:hypothetical protein
MIYFLLKIDGPKSYHFHLYPFLFRIHNITRKTLTGKGTSVFMIDHDKEQGIDCFDLHR